MTVKTVGVIGLGNIGNGVASSLARAEKWTVQVWDQDQSKREALDGTPFIQVNRFDKMAREADVIFFVVPSTREILSCLDGQDGIFAHAKSGLVIYDLTTSYPEDSKEVAEKAQTFGIHYLDAGTSGGPYRADTGHLLTMVGGEEKAFQETRDVLEAICEQIFYVGTSGTGHTLKLLHNIVCHATTLATAEAGHMAEKAGISLGRMIEVFNASNARSYASESRFPNHIVSKSWDGRSRIYNLHKDIGMGERLGKALEADTTYASATLEILKKAMALNMGEEDYTLLYRDFEKIRNVEGDGN